jgi:hypothetical protein
MGVTPEVVMLTLAAIQQNIAGVVAAVRKHAGGTLLVVGHNNTVPLIIAALGGPKLPEICDSVYDKLFVLVLGKEVRLVQSRYGASGSPIAADCKQ